MKAMVKTLAIAAATLAPFVHSLATFTAPVSDGPVYKVGIPSSSTISSTAQGGLYLQITASTDYQWVGLGIGTRMAGAVIFVMYADGAGNVTISGRAGTGHVEPQLDSTLMEGVTLLEGSGVVDGKMVANVHCTTCQLSSDKTSTSAPWIAAWNKGPGLGSKSLSEDISPHCDNCHSQFTYDLSQAALATDANPFIAAAPSSNPSSSPSSGPSNSPSSNPSASSVAVTSPAATSPSNPDDDDSGSDGSGSGSSSTISNDEENVQSYQKAHGILMGLTVAVLFPLGALFVRLHGHAWLHAGIQLVSLALMIAGLAVGVRLADKTEQLFNNTHSKLGVAVVALFLTQPFIGLIHHFLYRKTPERNLFSHVHIWYGRALMILAVVNGGLGLELSNNSKGGKIAYSIIAGVFGAVYIAVVALKRKGKSSGFRKSDEQPMREAQS